ncbi:MAG: hypothetical protein ACR2JC_21030 [Chloroflexota bacterium]
MTSESMARAFLALDEVAALPPNWDSYGSRPIQGATVDAARRLLHIGEVEGLPEAHVVPISGGGVQLEWYTPTRGLELVIHADGECEYVLVQRPDNAVVEGRLPSMDEKRVRDYMRRFMHAG